MVSKASEDLPEPDSPVNTTRRSRGMSRSISLRLCSRAPRMAMTRGSRASLVGSLAGRFLSKRSFIGKWLPFPQRLAAGYRARIRPERSENAELLPGRGGRNPRKTHCRNALWSNADRFGLGACELPLPSGERVG